ncbi:MAG TPA: HD domain-containing phosphohydrolase [Vulgatibacter sp.]|nr:HD domain-containing phosphohydrolase [Vulgatibacter sp.]
MESAPPHAPTILVVDDDPAVREVLTALLAEEGYRAFAVATADEALVVFSNTEPDLAICDMKMPGRDGLWLLDRLRREHPDTAVIMLTGFGDTESAVECLRRGAADFLLKPPKLTDLIRAIERALGRRRIDLARRRYQLKLEQRVEEKTIELSTALRAVEDAYTHTLDALVAALDAREHETSDHSQRVVRFTRAIAEQMGISGHELGVMCRGALLHDIGKIGVPDAILLKPGPLNALEWEEMRRHPEIGFQILRGIRFLEEPSQIVLAHQEHFDGKGYPRALRGEEIPLGARIFAIADTLDAITSDRPYRKGTSWASARAEILRCSGTQFDPEVVRAFAAVPDERWIELRRRKVTLAELGDEAGGLPRLVAQGGS